MFENRGLTVYIFFPISLALLFGAGVKNTATVIPFNLHTRVLT